MKGMYKYSLIMVITSLLLFFGGVGFALQPDDDWAWPNYVPKIPQPEEISEFPLLQGISITGVNLVLKDKSYSSIIGKTVESYTAHELENPTLEGSKLLRVVQYNIPVDESELNIEISLWVEEIEEAPLGYVFRIDATVDQTDWANLADSLGTGELIVSAGVHQFVVNESRNSAGILVEGSNEDEEDSTLSVFFKPTLFNSQKGVKASIMEDPANAGKVLQIVSSIPQELGEFKEVWSLVVIPSSMSNLNWAKELAVSQSSHKEGDPKLGRVVIHGEADKYEVRPGDKLNLTYYLANVGTALAMDLKVDIPLPASIRLVEGSIKVSTGEVELDDEAKAIIWTFTDTLPVGKQERLVFSVIIQ